jgi:hypothetical protein
MPQELSSEHIRISRLREFAEEGAVPTETEKAHLSSCEHCEHIHNFFSDEYPGRVLNDGDVKLKDFDKPA